MKRNKNFFLSAQFFHPQKKKKRKKDEVKSRKLKEEKIERNKFLPV